MPIDFRRDAPSSASKSTEVVQTPWSPSDLGAALALWLDATDTSSLTLDGSSVTQWADKSQNGHSVSQATVSEQPQWSSVNAAYQINGQPAVAFTGNRHSLASADFNLGTAVADHSTPIHVFSVGQLDLITGNEFTLFAGANATAEQFFGRWWQFGSEYFQANTRNIDEGDGGAEANQTAGLNAGTNPWIINVENNRQGNASFIRYNSADVSPENCAFGEEGFDGLVVGNNYWGGKSLGGILGEFLIITEALSQANRERVEGYLAHKWGLEANLPKAHPYRTAAP